MVQLIREAISRHFLPRRHSAFLAAIVAAMVVRVLMGDTPIGLGAYNVALMVLMLVSLYTIEADELVGEREAVLAQRRRRNLIGWALAVIAIAARLALSFLPSRRLLLADSIFILLFLCFITWDQLRSVLRQKEVTSETISMSISVYLLIAFSSGLFYSLIYQLQPKAFSFGNDAGPSAVRPGDLQHFLPVLVYFSLTTLATVGYGDITPVSLIARYAAVSEAIVGQFYLAILVARLVGIYMTRSLNNVAENRSRDPGVLH
jgi:hypothetical protein